MDCLQLVDTALLWAQSLDVCVMICMFRSTDLLKHRLYSPSRKTGLYIKFGQRAIPVV